MLYIILKKISVYLSRYGYAKATMIVSGLFWIISLILLLYFVNIDIQVFNKQINQVCVAVLENIFSACCLTLFAAIMINAANKYKEKDYTIHTFNYSLYPHEVNDIVSSISRTQTNKGYNPHLLEKNKMEYQIAEHLCKDKNSHIIVSPFQEICIKVKNVLENHLTTRHFKWNIIQKVDNMRTFVICVTYQDKIEDAGPKNISMRFFSSPEIDVPAIITHHYEYIKSKIINIKEIEEDNEYKDVNKRLRKFIESKIKYMNTYTILDNTNTISGIFVSNVAPTLKVLEDISITIQNNNKSYRIYVPSSWLRNWYVAQERGYLNYWDDYLRDNELITVLPRPIGYNLMKKSIENNAGIQFDIICEYVSKAHEFAELVKSEMKERTEFVEYEKVGKILKMKANEILVREGSSGKYPFLRMYSNGDVEYDPVIVKFRPNIGKDGFFVSSVY